MIDDCCNWVILRLSGTPLSYVNVPFLIAAISCGVGVALTLFLEKMILRCVSGVSPVELSTSLANCVSSSAGFTPSGVAFV